MKKLKGFALIAMIVVIASCNSSKVASTKKPRAERAERTERRPQTLADYLRGIPGVDVRGAGGNISVLVRVSLSITLSNEPIYTIDGVPVGTSYQSVAAMVNIEDIDSVKVLKSKSETVLYGSQGVNGVIAIKLKKR